MTFSLRSRLALRLSLSATITIVALDASSLFGQSGGVSGIVVDSETGEPLIGANVLIDGTTTGTATDLDGRYLLKVEAGSYTIVYRYIGFDQKVVEEIKVVSGVTTRIDISLSPRTMGFGEVIVEARSLDNTEATLLKQRQKAASFRDAISSEAISQTGSSDAAEAMSKVTGASVVGGKYVFVRGLGGRYSSTQLNGTNLPSADPDQNSAQLDLFPANLLDNIVATKTFTPDQPGSFSGGNINITTKAFPDGFTFKLTTGLAYNTEAFFSDNFLSGPTSKTDWLGHDNGLRNIPAVLADPNVVIPRPSQARRDPELAQQLDALSKSFNNVMAPRSGAASLNQNYAVSVGNQFILFGRPLGFVASGTYTRDFSGYDGGTTAQFEATDPSADSLNMNFGFSDASGTQSVGWGLLSNFAYRVHPYHELGLNYLRTQDGEQLARYQVGLYPKNTRPPVQFETYVLQYTERAVSSYQARGEHYLKALSNLRAEWNAALTSTNQEEPDLRFFFNQFVHVDLDRDGAADTTVYAINLGSSNATPPTRVFRDLHEDNAEANLNLEVPLYVGLSSPVQLKTGLAYLRKERSFRERKFNYRDNSLRFSDFGGDINAYFSTQHVGVIGESDGVFTFGNTIEEGTRLANNYDGAQEVLGLYGMLDVPLLRRLRLVGGVRYETTQIEIVSLDTTKTLGAIDERDLLPSLNVVYTLRENMNLRAAASRTLARPTFREIAPFTSFSFAGGPELSGNPDLGRSLISNYDLRWEWFVNSGEVFAVSGFYKYFVDPIERVIISNNNQISFVNVPNATVHGVEFEVRKNLGILTDALRHFSASANLALISSNVDVPTREIEFAKGFDIDKTRPFQGQSPYVLNAGLAYENYEAGTSASLFLSRFGERVSSVAIGGAPNVFEQPRSELFFSFGQRAFDALYVKFSMENVLGADFVENQEHKEASFVTRRYGLGRTVKLSFVYGF